MAKTDVLMPKEAQIGPYLWKYVKTKFPIDEYYGLCHQAQTLIEISTEQSSEVERDTVLHETLHACWFILGLPDEHEEEFILKLSPLLLDTLRRNPQLVEYLLQPSQ